jgi:hypothetical protein
MLSVGHCGFARLQMKSGHMDGMHCIIDGPSILVKIKSVALYNCQTVYEVQHVSGNTPPIIRSLKLHSQPPVFYTWKVVGHVVGRHCQAQYVPDNIHRPHVQQPFTYEKPEAASAVLGS